MKNQYVRTRRGKLKAISLKNKAARKARTAGRCVIGLRCSDLSARRNRRKPQRQKKALATSDREETHATSSTCVGCTAQSKAPVKATPSPRDKSRPTPAIIQIVAAKRTNCNRWNARGCGPTSRYKSQKEKKVSGR